MSDKKEWLECWVKNNFEVDSWDRTFWRASDQPTHKDSDETHFIEHAAYQAEKQRAERLEKELKEECHRSGEILARQTLRHQKENQKLRAALEKIFAAEVDLEDKYLNQPRWQIVSSGAKQIAKDALK